MTNLPNRPCLEQLRKQAKELLSAHQSGNRECCRVLKHLKRFSTISDSEILKTKIALHDAQYVIAIDYGFQSWAKLKKFVEQRNLELNGISEGVSSILKKIPSGENVLCADIGSSSLKIAEFANPVNGNYTLFSFAVEEYDLSDSEQNAFRTISSTLHKLQKKIGFKGSMCFLSLEPKTSFLRFIKLSPEIVKANNLILF